MERRDLIKDQIEQLGRVLSKILSSVLGTKSKVQVLQEMENTNQSLQKELDLDISFILRTSKNDLQVYFAEKNYTNELLEMLARYFFVIGEGKIDLNKSEAKVWLLKAKELLSLDVMEENTFTFSTTAIQNNSIIEASHLSLQSKINNLLKQL